MHPFSFDYSTIFKLFWAIFNSIELPPRIKCTMIPGDGVGPEIMDSVEEVLNSIGAPIDFEVYHLSEVHNYIVNQDHCSTWL